MSADSRDLARLQRWMQSVVTHPLGPDEGVQSRAAQEELPLEEAEIESVVLPSSSLTSTQRLNVYASAYYARLFECLRSEFPMLVKALGQDIFDEFAFGYLQQYPSTSYTLTQLGANFVRYMEETRPQGDGEDQAQEDWMHLLIDVARLEWAIGEVFDGPGNEGQESLSAEQLQTIPHESWPALKLITSPSLRLFQSRFPLNDYYAALRRDEQPRVPSACESYLALHRRDYLVRRYRLTKPQYHLLTALQQGESVGAAISAAAECEDADLEMLAGRLQKWFGDWTREGVFAGVKLPAA